MSDPDPLPQVPPVGAPSEPLLSVGTITAFAAAGLSALVAFGFNISDDRQAAIIAFVAIVAPLVVGAIGRRFVFAPDTVRAMVNKAAGRPGI